MVPVIAAGAIAMSDSALAVKSLNPNPSTNRGIARIPPPTPANPATNPMNAPTTISPTIVGIDHSS